MLNSPGATLENSPTVGVLYPGEMGAAFSGLLLAKGVPVVTTLRGRSEHTAGLAREAGVAVLDSLAEVVRRSQVVVSMVAPSAAAEMVDAYCELAHLAPPQAVYVDANSIGPELAGSLASKLARVGRDFVDAAINGLAKNIATGGTLYLSGRRAPQVAQLVGDAMRVRVLGPEPGQASTMKMLLGGLSKGLCALFVELATTAQRRDMLPQMLEACSTIYPGVMTVIERMLPTYARHAPRRATEMGELEQTARGAQAEPCLISAIRQLHEQLAKLSFDAADPGQSWTAASVVEYVVANGLLSAEPSADRKKPAAA